MANKELENFWRHFQDKIENALTDIEDVKQNKKIRAGDKLGELINILEKQDFIELRALWKEKFQTDQQQRKALKYFLEKSTKFEHTGQGWFKSQRQEAGEGTKQPKQTEHQQNSDYETNRNFILYGPPGTGKTYSLKKWAVGLIEGKTVGQIEVDNRDRDTIAQMYNHLKQNRQIEFVTFHPNYTYEDFVQGLKPEPTSGQAGVNFTYTDGIFKTISDRAMGFNELFELFESKVKSAGDKHLEIQMENGKSFTVLSVDDKKTMNLKNADGPVKKETVSKFFEKLVKTPSDENMSVPAHYIAKYIYALRLEAAKSNDLNHYVLIIDEINRANIASVFGELITLLEEDKRLGGKDHFEVTLPSGEPFSVPPNLFILGTMNTADKSIALVDVALRRRFQFIPFYPNAAKVKNQVYKNILTKLNAAIIAKKKKGYDIQIGHAYFMDIKDDDQLSKSMNQKVIPLLMEYFLNDSETVFEILMAALAGSGLETALNKENIDYKQTGIPKFAIP